MPAFVRVAKERFRVRLALREAELLSDLPGQLADLLSSDSADPARDRLFPPAYADPADAEADAEFRRLVGEDLLQGKQEAIEIVTRTLSEGRRGPRHWTAELDEPEALAWLSVLNDLRLTLGVRLGVTEDLDGVVRGSDPRAEGLRLLYYLGWLEEQLVEALAS